MPGEHTLKEIKESIVAVQKTIDKAGNLENIAKKLKSFKKIYCIGCGSSYWLAHILAELLRSNQVDVQTVVSSEILFYDYPENEQTLIIAFSQSGETTETLKALEQAKTRNAKTFAILNQEHSSIEMLSDFVFITPAGKEHMIATKSFDSALAAAYIFAKAYHGESYENIIEVPHLYEEILSLDISPAVNLLKKVERAFAIGTGRDYGVAGETALKLGESALIETVSLPILEISHGPKITTLNIPIILIAMQPKFQVLYENILAELKEVGAQPIVYAPSGTTYKNTVTFEFSGLEDLSIFSSIKLSQRLAVETALAKNLDPDNLPNLKKFVTRDDLNSF